MAGKEGVVWAVHARCVYWGDFVDPPRLFNSQVHVFSKP